MTPESNPEMDRLVYTDVNLYMKTPTSFMGNSVSEVIRNMTSTTPAVPETQTFVSGYALRSIVLKTTPGVYDGGSPCTSPIYTPVVRPVRPTVYTGRGYKSYTTYPQKEFSYPPGFF
jgi:hypothetical protein